MKPIQFMQSLELLAEEGKLQYSLMVSDTRGEGRKKNRGKSSVVGAIFKAKTRKELHLSCIAGRMRYLEPGDEIKVFMTQEDGWPTGFSMYKHAIPTTCPEHQVVLRFAEVRSINVRDLS